MNEALEHPDWAVAPEEAAETCVRFLRGQLESMVYAALD